MLNQPISLISVKMRRCATLASDSKREPSYTVEKAQAHRDIKGGVLRIGDKIQRSDLAFYNDVKFNHLVKDKWLVEVK